MADRSPPHPARAWMILALALGIGGSSGMAATVTFQNGVNGYQGAADTYVHGYHQDQGSWEAVWNYGHSPVLQVRGRLDTDLPSYKETALIRFDDLFGSGPLQIPGKAASIAAATLLLYCTSVEGSPAAIETSLMKTPWIEGTKDGADGTGGEVTGWYAGFDANRPTAYWGRQKKPGVGPVGGIDYDNTRSVVTPKTAIRKGAWISIDVTAFVRSWQAETPNLGVCLRPVQGSTWNGETFASSQGEAPHRPRLVVEYRGLDSAPPAAPSAFIPRACLARPATLAPVIDGALDDPCWSKSGWSDGFACDPAGNKPTQKTRFQVAYDQRALYIAIVCHEARPNQLVTRIGARDGEVFRDDCVELFVMKDPAVRSYYHLAVNAKGTRYDSLDGDSRVDLDWTVATRIAKDRWLAEVRIPFRGPLKAPATGCVWRLNPCRERKAAGAGKTDENSCWAFLARGFHEPESFGHLVFGSYAKALKAQAAEAGRIADTVQSLAAKAPESAGLATALGEIQRSLSGLGSRTVETEAAYRGGLSTIRQARESLRGVISRIQKAPSTGPPSAGRSAHEVILSHLGPYEALDQDPNAQLVYYTTAERKSQPVTLRFAQAINEYEHDAFVVSAPEAVEKLEVIPGDLVSVEGNRIPKEKVRCHLVGWITPLKGLDPYFAQWNQVPNPDLVEELDGPFSLDRLQSRHVWVTVSSFDVSPGVYRGAIACKHDGVTQSVGIVVEVWPLRLPRRSPLDMYLFTNLPWAGRSGEAWARLLSEHYVTYVGMEQPSDAVAAGSVVDMPHRELLDSDIPAGVSANQVQILGKRWNHRERLGIVRKYGMKVEFYCGKDFLQNLLPAYVRYMQDLGFSYADFRLKISDEDMDPGTLPIYQAYQWLDPHLRLVLCPAGQWKISPFRPFVDTYMCSVSVAGLQEWMRLFKLEQGCGKKVSLYTNNGSWAGRTTVLTSRQDFWDYIWEYRVDECAVWTMGVHPPLGYRWPYDLQTPRPSLVDIAPENQSLAQWVYFRGQGDFFKPIGCKRLESIRDGMKDYLYLSLLDNLIRQAQSRKRTQLADRGKALLERAVFLPKATWQGFQDAKRVLAQAILEMDKELNPYGPDSPKRTSR